MTSRTKLALIVTLVGFLGALWMKPTSFEAIFWLIMITGILLLMLFRNDRKISTGTYDVSKKYRSLVNLAAIFGAIAIGAGLPCIWYLQPLTWAYTALASFGTIMAVLAAIFVVLSRRATVRP